MLIVQLAYHYRDTVGFVPNWFEEKYRVENKQAAVFLRKALSLAPSLFPNVSVRQRCHSSKCLSSVALYGFFEHCTYIVSLFYGNK